MMARRMHSASPTRGCLGFCAAIIVTCALSVIVLGGNTYITDSVEPHSVVKPQELALEVRSKRTPAAE